MRVMTVRQPWAWAIVHGGKDVENRLGNITGHYRGPVAIHAGLKVDHYAAGDPTLAQALRSNDATLNDFMLLGHILGVVDLIGSHKFDTSDCWRDGPHGSLTMCSPWAQREQWHLEFAQPQSLAEPIPFRGALGLRELPVEVVAAIERAGVA